MLLALTLATLTLAPAPGAPPATVFRGIALDAKGRGQIPSGLELSAPGLRFVKSPDGIMYFPADYRLLTWTLTGPDQPVNAEIVVKDHDAQTWENARAIEAPVEVVEKKAHIRFAVPPGKWDLAVLVPGFAPAFGTSPKLEASSLQRAARLKARVLDTRSGKPPERWEAHVTRVTADPESEETKFFSRRPVSAGRATLDFASLPVGGWELEIDVPGKGRRSQLVSAPKPGHVADLGDLFISDGGEIRVVLEFPIEVPVGSFKVRITKRPPDSYKQEEIELGSQTVLPKPETTVAFTQIEPGPVMVRVDHAGDQMQRRIPAVIKEGQTAEVRAAFAPVRIHGRVIRADRPLPGAAVSAPQGEVIDEKQSIADEFGNYELWTWTNGKELSLFTMPARDEFWFPENVPVEEGAREVSHDVLLPSEAILVVVLDAETRRPIARADVTFQSFGYEKNGFGASKWTGDDGRAELRNLSVNKVDVMVSKDGYSTAEIRAVEPRTDDGELEVLMTRGRGLVVAVVDETGSPVGGAVAGMDPDTRGAYFQQPAKPAGAGRYRFPNAGPGPHLLGVMKCGYTMVIRTIQVPTGQDEEHIETITLSPERTPVVVHVQDENGAPVASSSFRWTLNGLPVPQSEWDHTAQTCGQATRSDSEGNLRLASFPPGILGASPPDSATVLGTFSNDGTQTVWTISIPTASEANARRLAAR